MPQQKIALKYVYYYFWMSMLSPPPPPPLVYLRKSSSLYISVASQKIHRRDGQSALTTRHVFLGHRFLMARMFDIDYVAESQFYNRRIMIHAIEGRNESYFSNTAMK